MLSILKNKKIYVITIISIILVLFLRLINVLQIENGLGQPLALIGIVIFLSTSLFLIQSNIDKNHAKSLLFYKNLDILKFISSILIIILHIRPFIGFSNELDLFFNNIITRFCVPLFFVITGYFVAKKEDNNRNYIDKYIKKTVLLYLSWSLIYLPLFIKIVIDNVSLINDVISTVNLPLYLLIILFVILLPFGISILLLYSGVYYHLWYFPALICSLFVLKKWKERFNYKWLLFISFILLLIGASETYFGVFNESFQQVLMMYFDVFYTTRNFLFFGLFYILLGFYLGKRKDCYSSYCFIKLMISIVCLVFEAIILHDFKRINSNIYLSCIPLVYYLFISSIYLSNVIKIKFNFSNYSKYYYLIHPYVIAIVSLFLNKSSVNPFIYIIVVVLFTHLISYSLLKIKQLKQV